MRRLVRSTPILSATAFAFVGLGCTGIDSVGEVEQASHGHTEIHVEDDCDPATFGALCDPNFDGNTTLDEFLAELEETQEVNAWEFGGGEIRVAPGQNFRVDSEAGEVHTFTVVAAFGGGRVPILNELSGNPVPAPECLGAASPTNVDIPAGGSLTVTTGPNGAVPAGTHRVQCCLHPWMRTTVQIR